MTDASSALGTPRVCCAVVDASGVLRGDSSAAVAPWWSFTKTLLAACVLLIAEEGRLRLDEPFGEHPFTVGNCLRTGRGSAITAACRHTRRPWPGATRPGRTRRF